MSKSFSNKLEAAKLLVKGGSVKRYIIESSSDRWIVVGRSRDYLNLVSPVWCRCYAFQKGIYQDPFFQCKHSLSVRIALKENEFEEFHLTKKEFKALRSEWISLS
ncbi:MAG: hypothetical protein ACXAB2_13365 [Candidatus Hodarchaeales archaeon]